MSLQPPPQNGRSLHPICGNTVLHVITTLPLPVVLCREDAWIIFVL
jgi:hypothetical protein